MDNDLRAAHDWAEALAAFEAALAAAKRGPRRFIPYLERRDCRRVSRAFDDVGRIERRLTALGVGRGSQWGILSAAPRRRWNLESTLQHECHGYPEEAKSLAQHLAGRLPALRARTLLEPEQNSTALEQAERELLTLIDEVPRAARRRLIDHLPLALRPCPETIGDLERVDHGVTLYVSEKGPKSGVGLSRDAHIVLHDIGIESDLRGIGLGSATLAELCLYADRRGFPILGKIEPGPDRGDDEVRHLAFWYAARGFTQAGRPPDRWVRMGLIRREPRATAP